ncbi:hypothetical protein P7K49_011159 [Saguinus oedipus]|uniref:Uncharacterized protein n=1 Tax=Saguinus oedipus TaxID=9490 RepID=A0ABQ9VS66_SAGOE|nr:hypothetical protein P7K49_011159 [Saguinus oedipus]
MPGQCASPWGLSRLCAGRAAPWHAHNRSPVLIPRLLRSWIISWGDCPSHAPPRPFLERTPARWLREEEGGRRRRRRGSGWGPSALPGSAGIPEPRARPPRPASPPLPGSRLARGEGLACSAICGP